MASRGTLNDAEVAAEMNKMVSFIRQEALERAREIKLKADEEFNIEKAKIVRQETLTIEAFFEKKRKQADVQRKIAQSNHLNKARLRVLQARHELLQELTAAAAKRLQAVPADSGRYAALLRDLIFQALLQLLEPKVTVQGRKQDAALLQKAIQDASRLYQERVGRPVEVEFDKENALDAASAGGIIVSAQDGRIRAANTLEKRLETAAEGVLPELRYSLFGPSASRKFFD